MFYRLYDRQRAGSVAYGLSCDEDGVFVGGDVALVTHGFDVSGRAIYKARSPAEIGWLLAKAYGAEIDFSNQIEGLKRIAAYMTDGKWALAKIATVQLRFPELPDGRSMKALMAAEAYLAKCQCKIPQIERKVSSNKRDVSDEPRVPAGQNGGGQWTTTDAGSPANMADPLLVPAQAITANTRTL